MSTVAGGEVWEDAGVVKLEGTACDLAGLNGTQTMAITRRELLGTGVAGAVSLAARRKARGQAGGTGDEIDRRAVVERHNPVVRRIDPFSALSVGNGEFAFTADVTGLQT